MWAGGLTCAAAGAATRRARRRMGGFIAITACVSFTASVLVILSEAKDLDAERPFGR
jgi:hypothetical protein